MNNPAQHPPSNVAVQTSGDLSQVSRGEPDFPTARTSSSRFPLAGRLTGLVLLLVGAPSARAHENDTGNPGVNTELNLPCIQIAGLCVGSVGENGAIAFTGSVTNCGNTPLVGVTVTNQTGDGALAVLFPTRLAVGQAASFSGSFVPSNPCVPGTAWLVAQGNDPTSPRTLVASNRLACSIVTTPRLMVSQGCPRNVGGVLTYTGSVSNAGNITLAKILVRSDRAGGNIVFGVPALAPGAAVSFSGSYGALTDACSVVSTLTATARDGCNGSNLLATATVTCPLLPGPILPPSAGTFSGLFFETNGVRVGNSGSFTFTTTRLGTYTAALRSGGKRYLTRGRLSPDGRATNSIARLRANALTVTWEVQSDGSDTLLGTVTDGQWISGLMGDRAVFNARTNPAPQAGRYTLILPGTPGGNGSPEGDGYGTAIVDRNGVARFNGRLADGTFVSQSARISKHRHWPMYVSLYAGRGSLMGWLLFTNRPNDDLAGRLSWICPEGAARNRYPAGFGVDCDSLGSRYVPPIGATRRVLEFTNGVILLSGGDLTEASAHGVILGPTSRVTSVGPNRMTLSFTLSSGLFRGTCLEPGTARTRPFQGAVLQKANYGSGWFPGTHEMGRVVLYAAP